MARRAPYRVILSPAAQRDLRKLPESVSEHLKSLILRLEHEPRPPGCRKMQGQASAFRIRFGRYRVMYDVSDNQRLVEVLHVLRRSETTYRRLT